MVAVGDKAPDFTLPDVDLKQRSLREYVGKKKIVLAFFPLAFSPVCTNELCSLRDSEAAVEPFGGPSDRNQR